MERQRNNHQQLLAESLRIKRKRVVLQVPEGELIQSSAESTD